VYKINLNKSADLRLEEFLTGEEENIRAVITGARGSVPWWLQGLAAPAKDRMKPWSGGLFDDEVRRMADFLGESFSQLQLLQFSYELNHLAEYLTESHIAPIGCTTGVRAGVHFRTMDWDIPAIERSTRIVEYLKGRHKFYGVTVPGFVGVLTGMVPGEYSVALNYAACDHIPARYLGAAFLLRKTLEECRTFDEAIGMLQDTPIASPAFYTVCDGRSDNACVIERQSESAAVRWKTGPYIVQANHYCLTEYTDDPELLEWSHERANCMADSLGMRRMPKARDVLNVYPVKNETTQQRVVMVPRLGKIELIKN